MLRNKEEKIQREVFNWFAPEGVVISSREMSDIYQLMQANLGIALQMHEKLKTYERNTEGFKRLIRDCNGNLLSPPAPVFATPSPVSNNDQNGGSLQPPIIKLVVDVAPDSPPQYVYQEAEEKEYSDEEEILDDEPVLHRLIVEKNAPIAGVEHLVIYSFLRKMNGYSSKTAANVTQASDNITENPQNNVSGAALEPFKLS